jgi:hypothetical protein
MMLNSQNRRLGDYVAGTVVVHDKRTQEVGKFRIRPLHGLEQFLGHVGGYRLRSNLRVLSSGG